jgi:hypothetical protein
LLAIAVGQATALWLECRHRQQAGSYRDFAVGTGFGHDADQL